MESSYNFTHDFGCRGEDASNVETFPTFSASNALAIFRINVF
jgi:hypothetical protein